MLNNKKSKSNPKAQQAIKPKTQWKKKKTMTTSHQTPWSKRSPSNPKVLPQSLQIPSQTLKNSFFLYISSIQISRFSKVRHRQGTFPRQPDRIRTVPSRRRFKPFPEGIRIRQQHSVTQANPTAYSDAFTTR